ncbi:MAG: hypothetical protein M3362_20565 [Acidobacteriota bacterium]|nr:hypothetical protein [Acidobacteriota bacterium]
MNNDLIMKAITLSGEEKKVLSNGSTVVKIKDEKGLSYSFFMKKQDGTISKAYGGIQNFQLGDTVEIYFSEQEKSYEGKSYTLRSIAFFGEKVSPSAQAEKHRGEAPSVSQGGSNDAFGRRLGVQGHINSLLSNPEYYNHLLVKGGLTIERIVNEAIAIEVEAEKQLNPSAFRQAVQAHAPKVVLPEEELPTLQQGEDISVEDIPF